MDEPFSAGVGKMVLLNISQIGLLYRGRLTYNKNHGQVENVDVSDISDFFFSNCYQSPKVKYNANMDFKNPVISKCRSF